MSKFRIPGVMLVDEKTVRFSKEIPHSIYIEKGNPEIYQAAEFIFVELNDDAYIHIIYGKPVSKEFLLKYDKKQRTFSLYVRMTDYDMRDRELVEAEFDIPESWKATVSSEQKEAILTTQKELKTQLTKIEERLQEIEKRITGDDDGL